MENIELSEDPQLTGEFPSNRKASRHFFSSNFDQSEEMCNANQRNHTSKWGDFEMKEVSDEKFFPDFSEEETAECVRATEIKMFEFLSECKENISWGLFEDKI